MNAPAVLVPRPPTEVEQPPADDGLTLLLDMFVPAEAVRPPVPHVPGTRRAALRARLHEWVRRAANWGAGPQRAWCAW